MTTREITGLSKQTYQDWSAHRSQTMGASLAYFTVLSLAPLLVIAVAIAGLAFGKKAVEGLIVYQISDLVGAAGAQAIQTILANAKSPSQGIVATALGFLTLLVGASGVFNELRNALNTIWDVKPTSSGLRSLVKEQLRSFGLVLSIGFLLLVSLIVSAVLSGVSKFVGAYVPVSLLWISDLVISLVVITVLFALMYRVVPDTHILWTDVWIGAAATAILFALGKLLIGVYLGRASVGSAYGAAGSLVIVLVWVYYSAQILLFGAEFTHVYALRKGSRRNQVRQRPSYSPKLVPMQSRHA